MFRASNNDLPRFSPAIRHFLARGLLLLRGAAAGNPGHGALVPHSLSGERQQLALPILIRAAIRAEDDVRMLPPIHPDVLSAGGVQGAGVQAAVQHHVPIHAGQVHRVARRGAYETPGKGRADVWLSLDDVRRHEEAGEAHDHQHGGDGLRGPPRRQRDRGVPLHLRAREGLPPQPQ
eukprot:scaffold1070_cov245-Pinguiococcus_pyrenoidosus.AAC.34